VGSASLQSKGAYEIPISVRYGDSVSQRTYSRLRRRNQVIPHYVASVSVRCSGDDNWRSIDGVVVYDYDDRGRLAALGIGFDLSCDSFYVGDPSVVAR
jgi:hypothetical protein